MPLYFVLLLGLSQKQVRVPHPSRGGNPYSGDFRHDVITRWQHGIALDTPDLQALQDVYSYSSMIFCRRYIQKMHNYGHVHPMNATGNHEAEREILGQALIRFALFRCVHLKAIIDHARAFLLIVVPYTPSQVVRAKQLLGLRMKTASSTCERTYLPNNLRTLSIRPVEYQDV